MPWQPDVAHAECQKRGASQDQSDHAIQPRAAQQTLFEGGPAQRALHARDDQRAQHTNGGGFSGGGHARIDAAQHRNDQQHHRDEVTRFTDLLRKAHGRVGSGHQPRVAPRPEHQIARKKRGQHDTRQHTGNEQLGDGNVSADAVNDHDDRGRDEQTQRARTGQ